ncbi:mitochondrial import inner membrane translocase subunit Tim21 isoform X2 [Chanos chanos]|uniref:Mitochondrial import inner membrane translocase subunit Tim21 n=1 Tax=Chanos chanos TaxID=29144 RepID=A0A6J2UZX9_CHACN|nr:mitochondrial import inner membrane translocase subunit Tim21 isoform X2 [Chanos chanos]
MAEAVQLPSYSQRRRSRPQTRPVLQKLTEPLPDLSKLTLKHSRLIHVGSRLRNTGESGQKDSSKVSISKSQPPPPGLSATQKVKQAGKDFTYLIVVLIGLGVTGGLLYVVFQELFSSSSPSKIYGKAFNKCRSHPEVIGAFGEPIKGYGETTRRGRRQQVSHVEYLKDGLKHMRLKFYIEGSEPGIKGTVHSESKENPETGKYEFRYIFVDVDSYPRRTIVVEDNR